MVSVVKVTEFKVNDNTKYAITMYLIWDEIVTLITKGLEDIVDCNI